MIDTVVCFFEVLVILPDKPEHSEQSMCCHIVLIIGQMNIRGQWQAVTDVVSLIFT